MTVQLSVVKVVRIMKMHLYLLHAQMRTWSKFDHLHAVHAVHAQQAAAFSAHLLTTPLPGVVNGGLNAEKTSIFGANGFFVLRSFICTSYFQNKQMVPPGGFEPTTGGFLRPLSLPLDYGGILFIITLF